MKALGKGRGRGYRAAAHARRHETYLLSFAYTPGFRNARLKLHNKLLLVYRLKLIVLPELTWKQEIFKSHQHKNHRGLTSKIKRMESSSSL